VRVDGIDLPRRHDALRCANASSSCRRRGSSSPGRCATTCAFGRPEATDEEVEIAPPSGFGMKRNGSACFPEGLDTRGGAASVVSRLSAGEAAADLARPRAALRRSVGAGARRSDLEPRSRHRNTRSSGAMEEPHARPPPRSSSPTACRLAARAPTGSVSWRDGRLAELGSHDELVALGGHYGRALTRTWSVHQAQPRRGPTPTSPNPS